MKTKNNCLKRKINLKFSDEKTVKLIVRGKNAKGDNMIKLTTAAKDNYGHSYETTLVRKEDKHIIMFDSAPGGWCAEDLAKEYFQDKLALDFGQGWYCTNIQDVLTEIRSMMVMVIK